MSIKSLTAMLLALLLVACKTPQDIAYFQDTTSDAQVQLKMEAQFRLRPDDKLNILVNSKDPSLSALFTLTSTSMYTLGATTTPQMTAGRSSSSSCQSIAYTVDANGDIDFPVLGTIHVQGMTRSELAKHIKETLISQKLVLDPVVTVEYVNLAVSVLGEVNHPGRIDVVRDNYSILDAIADAGDLTINGMRDNVKVLRKVDGKLTTYELNLCSAQSLTSSPGFYLQQNDIVYVTPSDKRKRDATASGNTVLTPAFWISVASFLTTITALIIR